MHTGLTAPLLHSVCCSPRPPAGALPQTRACTPRDGTHTRMRACFSFMRRVGVQVSGAPRNPPPLTARARLFFECLCSLFFLPSNEEGTRDRGATAATTN